MHDGMPYGRNQGQGRSREVDRQSPTGLIFFTIVTIVTSFVWIQKRHCGSVNIEKLPIPIELMINIIGHYCL